MKKQYVAYYRTSTKQQNLGIEAQRKMVRNFVQCADCIIQEYEEKESGRNDDRPQLAKALEECKRKKATLVIAKLDRLSRKVSFIAALMESNVHFVCADMPSANEFTIHIFAALAQQERQMISERTKKALAELKSQGITLGKPENLTDDARRKGNAAVVSKRINNGDIIKAGALAKIMRERKVTLQAIADELNEKGFKTAQGKNYSRTQVLRLLRQ